MWPSKIKIIAAISVFLLLYVFLAPPNQQYLPLISITSSIVQIVLFVAWYLEENPLTQKTIDQVDVIYKNIQAEKIRNSKKEEFIKTLLREGAIEEQELRTLLSKIQNDDILLIHTYGEGTPAGLKKKTGLKSGPVINLLARLGFVRVFGKHNLFLMPIKDLPQELHNVQNFEKFFNSEIEKSWRELQKKTTETYPQDQYKIMQKWRSGEGYKVSYIISKAPKKDLIAGFKNRYSFTPEFVAVILRRAALIQKLPTLRNTVKVKELVKRTSIELLLTNFPQSLKEKIIIDEKKFIQNLNLSSITDLRNMSVEKITKTLQELDPEQIDCGKYSQELIGGAKELYELLVNLGVTDV